VGLHQIMKQNTKLRKINFTVS